MIRSPAPRLLAQALPVFVRRVRARRRPLHAELNLVALVGMLTMLVFYLLPTFSDSGELCCCSHAEERLPQARSGGDLEPAPIISISHGAIALNGEPKADGLAPDFRGLYEDLSVLRENFRLLHPKPEEWEGKVLLEADRDLGFGQIHQVMTVCRAAGYARVQLVVRLPDRP